MEENRRDKTGAILTLTLEILYLLTGEDYTIVKKTSGECVAPRSRPCVSGGWSRRWGPITDPPPHSLIPESNNEKKILELTNKMIELLTGEVNNDRFKYSTMENHQHDGSSKRNPAPAPLDSQECAQEEEEDQNVLQDYQEEDLMDIKVEVVEEEEEEEEEEMHLMDEPQCKEEEIPEDISPGAHNSSDTPKELLISTGDLETENKDIVPDSSSVELATQKRPSDPSSLAAEHEPHSQDNSNPPTDSAGNGRRIYPCAECGKSFHNGANLSRHLRIHTGLKPFSCSECGKSFTHKSMLDAHRRIHTGEKPFTCSECGRCFTQKSHLMKHQVIHTGEKPFLCSECGKCFMQKSDLLKHLKVHTGEKPFPCSQCGRRFASNLDLSNHRRMHTGEKPFPCFECGKCFTQKSILVNHIKIHTGERPFQCPECGKCFAQKSKLLGHRRTHTGEKPYSCSDCGKLFGHKSSLVKHRQRVHTLIS